MRINKHTWIISWLLFLFLLPTYTLAADSGIILEVNGAITPAVQDYVERNIILAEENHAKLIILNLNTPGGLDTSMRGINEAIINSSVPVIVYVTPSGARAASAGTFIAYAGHMAAMAPGTNIGAASPINLMGKNPSNPKDFTSEQKKALNDAAAYIRSLAQLHGKNAVWAESAVRDSASISADEAKKLKVIDVIANDYPELLQKLDGQTVTVHGTTTKLATKNLQLTTISPGWRYQFLSFITNPNIAYLLMLIAIYGLFFEFSSPGMILPGVVGVLALILVLYAFQLMPINYTGLTLILVGIVFMVCEVYISSFGIIGFGGIIAFILGSIMLFDFNDPNYRLTWLLIISMCILTLIFFFILLNLAIRSHKKGIVTGQEGLIGMEGVVLEVMNQQIVVRVLGEIWEARSTHILARGQKIKVVDVHGLTLTVKPISVSHERGES